MAKTKVREILKSEDTTKEKIGYLWDYYHIHVIVALVGLLFTGYLFMDWVNRPITTFHVTVLAPDVSYDEEQELTEELNVAAGTGRKKRQGICLLHSTWPDGRTVHCPADGSRVRYHPDGRAGL
ncbi:MAG: hypothetical protein U5K84_06790 [Alkalibacterium sp.]|nr:hypothetical protein [Alkalibacterium sp.]